MHPNEQLINDFYTAFQNKDFEKMAACYHSDVIFDDEAFHKLSHKQVSKMWEMLLLNGKDLEITFDQVSADDKHGEACWIAIYTFSKTGRKVKNIIHAHFDFQDGKIIRHRDQFNFYRWARQAFGAPGIALGWTPFFRKKVQKFAASGLRKFMERN